MAKQLKCPRNVEPGTHCRHWRMLKTSIKMRKEQLRDSERSLKIFNERI